MNYFSDSEKWIGNRVSCSLFVSLDVTCCTASILHLCVIAWVRYKSVSKVRVVPYTKRFKSVFSTIFGIWALAAFLSVAPFFLFRSKPPKIPSPSKWNSSTTPFSVPDESDRCIVNKNKIYRVVATTVAFYAPLAVILVIYWKMARIAWSTVKKRRFRGGGRPGTRQKRRNRKSSPFTLSQKFSSVFRKQQRATNESTTRQTTDVLIPKIMINRRSSYEFEVTNGDEKQYCATSDFEFRAVSHNDSVLVKEDDRVILRSHLERSRRQNTAIINRVGSRTTNPSVSTFVYSSEYVRTCLFTTSGISAANSLSNIDPFPSNLLQSGKDAIPQEFRDAITRRPDECQARSFLTVPSEGTGIDSGCDLDKRKTIYRRSQDNEPCDFSACVQLLNNRALGLEMLKVKEAHTSARPFPETLQVPLSPPLRRRTNSHCFLRSVSRDLKTRSENGRGPISRNNRRGNRRIPLDAAAATFSRLARIKARRERKIILTLGLVIGAFVVCWLPFFAKELVIPFCEPCSLPPSVELFINWLGYFNSALNPIIYAFSNTDFSAAFRKICCDVRGGWRFKRQTRFTTRNLK